VVVSYSDNIDFLETEVSTEPQIGYYVVHADKSGWRGKLERLCLWGLRKLKSPVWQKPVIKQRRLSMSDVIDTINKQRDIIGRVHRERVRHILMGPDNFMEFREALIVQHVAVDFSYDVDGIRTYVGLTVHIIPWMTGILLVPDLPSLAAKRDEGAEVSIGQDDFAQLLNAANAVGLFDGRRRGGEYDL